MKAIETDPEIITPSDMLHLTRAIEQGAASQVNKTSVPSGILRSMASSYLVLASVLLDPVLARQWVDMKPLGVCSKIQWCENKCINNVHVHYLCSVIFIYLFLLSID